MEEKAERSAVPPPPPPPGEGNGVITTDRNALVDLAVKFLNNPRVKDRQIEEKKAFLRKKGLSEAEMNTAINRAGLSPTPLPVVTGPPPLPPRVITPPPRVITPPPRVITTPPQPRSWSEYAVMAVVVSGVGYAVIHFMKNYVVPWLRAPKIQEEKLDDINTSVKQLQVTVTESTRAIQALLTEQQQHIQILTSQVTGLQTSLSHQTNGQPFQQIKEEINSLKGILLSRHQFPPTPNRGGVANGVGIPTWQRTLPPSETTTPTKKPEHYNEEVKIVGNGNLSEIQNGDVQNANEITENGTVPVNGNLQDELLT